MSQFSEKPATAWRVALLTDTRFSAEVAPEGDWYLANILRDDALLRDALSKHGIHAERVVWSDPTVDWSGYDMAVFRTTWDYYERFAEFALWVERVSKRTRICNNLATIRWNADKHYLGDLERRGISIVPCHFIEPGDATTLRDYMRICGWSNAIVKPCISGGARLTYRVNPDNADEIDTLIAPYRAQESFMLQPFVHSVQVTGEDSLMVFNGIYTHAVRKRPKSGDFRVQDDHGGTVAAHTASSEQIDLALRAMQATGHGQPVYGRADMVQLENGSWAIMELELLEPELWIRYEPASAEHFARALVKALVTNEL
jgi:glutathione synthase/RimK-type ligase-like ATP-grasp enzyme